MVAQHVKTIVKPILRKVPFLSKYLTMALCERLWTTFGNYPQCYIMKDTELYAQYSEYPLLGMSPASKRKWRRSLFSFTWRMTGLVPVLV